MMTHTVLLLTEARDSAANLRQYICGEVSLPFDRYKQIAMIEVKIQMALLKMMEQERESAKTKGEE